MTVAIWVSSCCCETESCASEQFVAFEIDPGILQHGLVFGHLALGLGELHLKRPRINFREQVTLADDLSFLKRHFDQLPIDPGADRHGV